MVGTLARDWVVKMGPAQDRPRLIVNRLVRGNIVTIFLLLGLTQSRLVTVRLVKSVTRRG